MPTHVLPDLGNVVGIMAHPDDLFYAAAGLMHHVRTLGHNVTSVSATSGGAGSQDHDRWPPERIAGIREQEDLDAHALIGVKDVRFLHFIDGELHLVPFEDGVVAILGIFEEVKPHTVITYGPDGLFGHSDHQVISAWTTEAFRRAELPGAKLLYVAATTEWVEEIVPILQLAHAIYEVPPTTPTSKLFIDYHLPPEILKTKLRGIDAHVSQSTPLGDAIGGLDKLTPWFVRETFRAA